MPTKYVPEGLTLMELAGINWVLARIKTAMLKGEPSGRAIDDALDEIMAMVTTQR